MPPVSRGGLFYRRPVAKVCVTSGKNRWARRRGASVTFCQCVSVKDTMINWLFLLLSGSIERKPSSSLRWDGSTVASSDHIRRRRGGVSDLHPLMRRRTNNLYHLQLMKEFQALWLKTNVLVFSGFWFETAVSHQASNVASAVRTSVAVAIHRRHSWMTRCSAGFCQEKNKLPKKQTRWWLWSSYSFQFTVVITQ